MKDGINPPSFMSNKNVIIIILYTRMRHVQFKWRSCRWGWWRTIDPSTLVDKTDVKDGINPPSFSSNKNVIIIILYTRREWDMYNLNGVHVGEGGEEQLIPPPSSIKLTWRMVLIYRHSCQLQISLNHLQYEWVGGGWHEGWYISTAIHVKRWDFYGAGSCPCIMY